MTGRLRTDWESMMTDNSNASQLSPAELIEQALDVIMNRFDLDAEHAMKVLRSMSRETRTQMCVVAEQLVEDNDPVRPEKDAPLRLISRTKQ
jgi:AmiR/NasT family two-component response regulator